MEVDLRWNQIQVSPIIGEKFNLRTAFDNMSDEDKLVRSELEYRTLSESAQKIDFDRMSVDER